MPYEPFKHHRRSIRLRGYDYSQAGAYFVTICTHNRDHLFGEITEDGEMSLNEFGQIVREEWLRSKDIRKEIELDEWIIMPNHLHGIVIITQDDNSVGAHGDAPDAAHGDAPDAAHGDAPDAAHGDAPNLAHGDAPDAAPGDAPDAAPGDAPDAAPGDAPDAARVGAQGIAPNRADSRPPLQRRPRSLGSFVAGFKSSVTTRINQMRDAAGAPIWQRDYYEHIIRNEREWNAIAKYIHDNPTNWGADLDNPANFPKRPPPKASNEYWRDVGL